MAESSKDLLHLESADPSVTAIESKLLVCSNSKLKQVQNPKPKPPEGVPLTSSLPKSQVMGKVKDFLGVISEANKRLDDAKDNVKDHDIEVLTGNESQYIEMDLMLGVADLHTPEAVAAAESAVAGYQPVLSLASDDSESEEDEDQSSDNGESSDNDSSEDGEDEKDDHEKKTKSEVLYNESSGKSSENTKSRKRPKIVELS